MSIQFNDNLPSPTSSTWELLCKILLVLNNSGGSVSATSSLISSSGNLSLSTVYQANTSSGPITVTLPASPSAGNSLWIEDAALTWNTNNVTIDRNGSNINSAASNYVANVQGGKLSISYIDSTIGWSIK